MMDDREKREMKFKYNLGDRVLFKHTTKSGTEQTEVVGTITGLTYSVPADGSGTPGWTYTVNHSIGITDSDILGTVTVKRALAPRVRKKKTTQAQTELNGKAEGKDTTWEQSPTQ